MRKRFAIEYRYQMQKGWAVKARYETLARAEQALRDLEKSEPNYPSRFGSARCQYRLRIDLPGLPTSDQF